MLRLFHVRLALPGSDNQGVDWQRLCRKQPVRARSSREICGPSPSRACPAFCDQGWDVEELMSLSLTGTNCVALQPGSQAWNPWIGRGTAISRNRNKVGGYGGFGGGLG
jgi:hypothetical protein